MLCVFTAIKSSELPHIKVLKFKFIQEKVELYFPLCYANKFK